MDCEICEQTRQNFICTSCLGRNLQDHSKALRHLIVERDALITKAGAALGPINAARGRRADVSSLRLRIEDIHNHTRLLREQNESTRELLTSIRSILATRRHTLDEAYRLSSQHSSPPRTPTPTPPGGPPRRPFSPLHEKNPRGDSTQELIKQGEEAHLLLQEALARARQGLVQELVDVFDIVEVGGRPAQGVRAATRGEWAIGGLVLPVPGDIRRYTPSQINAAITFAVHFLALLTFYLGIKLPFQIAWSGGKLGVGVPEIYAGKGSESGGWAKWTVRNPLHLPLTSSSSTTNSPPPSSPTSPVSSPRVSASPYPPAPVLSTADSQSELDRAQGEQPPASFTTALAMLLYDVAYLAHTQGVVIPLSVTGEVLGNLYAVCCSAELGRRSHDSHPLLPPPTPPSFTLDFKQLLQATTADPVSRARPRSTRKSATTTAGARDRHDRIEEEDEWEVVGDDP